VVKGLSMYLVREFREEDVYDVFRIAYESLTEKYSLDLFMDIYYAWPSGFLVAEIKDIVGFIAGSQYNGTARILMLAVDKNNRGKGIGSLLLRKFIFQCKKEGIKSVSLEVRTSNKSAIEFYINRGFQIISLLNKYYTNGESAYIMWKML